MMPFGTFKYFASSLTFDFKRLPSGSISTPPSPYFVKYPTVISLLLPVPTTK
ncbi:hypothetical protein ES703_70460 [subsurface metagenome]